MALFYNTQNNFFSTTNSNLFNFTNTNFKKNNLYDTYKTQQTNFTTFQSRNFNTTNLLKDKDIYNIIKLQYTLVFDFLSKINMSFTLKTFNNEIKTVLNPPVPFTHEEISKLIEINENDIGMQTNTFLDVIKTTYLYNLIFAKSNLLTEEKEVQTSDDDNDNNNNINDVNNTLVKKNNFFSTKTTKIDGAVLMQDINEKLRKIDKKYDNYKPDNKSVELTFINYKNELEKKYKEELKNEIERIKNIEIGNINIEENKKYLDKIEEIRNEYETNYEIKNKELSKKEKELKEKVNNIEDSYIEKTKELNQKYQQKEDNLNQKESNFRKKCIKELKNIKEKQISLDKKERELYVLKKDYYKEMQKEIDKIKNEFKQIFKEQIEKIKYESEQELEKEKNKLKLRKINYDISILKNIDSKEANDQYIKEILLLKEELKKIKIKMNKSKYHNKLLIDNEMENEKLNENLYYYEQLSNLELKLNDIINRKKFKFYNRNKEEEKSIANIVIKDENIQKKYEELENEQNGINKQIEKDLKNITKENPEVKLTKEEIERIKKNNYNILLYNLAKDKELNEIYKKELEEENIKNKIKFINEVNENIKENYEKEINKERYIIIDVNEMERNKQLLLKLYIQRREQQKIDEINKQKEKIKQRELKEKEIKEREIKEREEREKRNKSKEKEEEKSFYSKSIKLGPVRVPGKSSVIGNDIEDLIHKSKIRIASSHVSFADSPNIIKDQKKEEIKEEKEDEKNSDAEDEYGSGDFVDLSHEDKKSKSKLETSNKAKEISGDDDLSGKIDMILNQTHTDKLSEINEKDITESYNDFETSNALDKKGIVTENSEQDKNKSKNSNDQSNTSSEDSKF